MAFGHEVGLGNRFCVCLSVLMSLTNDESQYDDNVYHEVKWDLNDNHRHLLVND